MNRVSKVSITSFLVLIIFTVSCHKKDPTPDCGCNGRIVGRFENARASYLGSGSFTIFKEDGKTYKAYLAACKPDSSWTKSPDFKVPDYIISGNIKKDCFTGQSLIIRPSPFEITAIKKD